MSQKGDRTREGLVQAMIEKLQANGYSGAALNDVVAHANAPRGSLYFHFPAGKEQLAVAAIEAAAGAIEAQLELVCRPATVPAQVVEYAARAMGNVLEQSDFRKGCPIAAVAATIGEQTPDLQRACAQAFERWVAVLTTQLTRTGLSPARAGSFAETTLACVEGALIIARARHTLAPLEAVIATQVRLLQGEHA